MEIDQLHDDKFFKITTESCSTKVLWVYQTKLTSVPINRRWKPIPIIFEEQHEALAIINSKIFKRPLVKTIKLHFGEATSLYGGRKGFTDLMIGLGQRLEDISQWLGHRSIERTWRNYKDFRIFHYQKLD